MKIISFFLICLMLSQSAFSQKRKVIKEKKVKSKTEWVYKSDKDTLPRKELIQEYNKDGYTTLKIDYNKESNIKLKETAKYDRYGNVIEESFYTAKENQEIKYMYKYNAKNDMVEKEDYIDDILQNKTTYKYNAAGNVVLETIFDDQGNLFRNISFTYNSKNLKELKRVTDVDGNVISIKKYYYEYH